MNRPGLTLLAFLALACPGGRPEDSSQNAPPKTTTTTRSPQAVPENSTAMNPVAPSSPTEPAASPTADVQLLEYDIRVTTDAFRSGPHRLRIANAGKEQHSLAIEGPGISERLAGNLAKGDTAELAVTLKPGTYTVWCPVDGHRGKGMQRTLTVK